ncbi:MAG: ABC transporter permease [Oscillospiraceae bacterium]|nr:ABC transporter permease [Oscillospiraceae bacterium]
MKQYLIRRFLQLIPVVFLVSVFSYFIITLAPGDPAEMYITDEMTEEQIQAVYEEMGLDKSVPEQYAAWLGKVLKGDFGKSLYTSHPVTEEIEGKLGNTILLMGTAFIWSLIVAVPVGLICGMKKGSLFDRAVGAYTHVAVSVPNFWLAIMMIYLFSLKLGILPTSGMHALNNNTTWDLIKHMIMPVMVLSIETIAVFIKYVRSNTISQMEEDYVLTAESKGCSGRQILFGHVMKNTLLPIITLCGMRLSSLVVGSFITESVFGWPGLGRMGMTAINNRDYPLIMAYTMLSCVMLIIGNFVADLLYAAADPRVKKSILSAVDKGER